MLNKMMVSLMVTGILGAYITFLYALLHLIAAIDHSYMLSLAM